MTRKQFAVRILAGLLALPVIVLGLFLLNGLVLCDGDTPRAGTVRSETALRDTQPDDVRILAFNIAKCFVYQGGVTFAARSEVEARLTEIAQIIRSAHPDIVCLSETVRECYTLHMI